MRLNFFFSNLKGNILSRGSVGFNEKYQTWPKKNPATIVITLRTFSWIQFTTYKTHGPPVVWSITVYNI